LGRKTNAKERLRETAAELFWRNGYESTAVSEILKESDLGSGSLYWFYRNKEELLIAVLDNYRRRLEPVIERPVVEGTDDPIERVFRILDEYRRFLIETRFELGCPIGNIVLELGDRYPAVRKKTEELFADWRGMIVRCLEPVMEQLTGEHDVESLAAFVLTVMEGGVMQARAHKEITYFDHSVAHLRRYFEAVLRSDRKSKPHNLAR
jgi:AcrR family transcriptional regulator